MVRKLIAVFIAIGLCLSMTLGASASPLSTAPEHNMYTQSIGPEANPQPEDVPLAAALVGVVATAAALAYVVGLEDGRLNCMNTCSITPFATNEHMERVFDN